MHRLAVVLLLLLAACASHPPPRPVLEPIVALAPTQGTALDARAETVLAAHPGESGFRLVTDGVEAFALRAASARAAGRSLDIQYYIWHADTTGRLLARELATAADRGVRVRLLLDDLDAREHNFALAGLDAHPNIEVRVFNPFGSREGTAGKAVEFATGLRRLNHRMHNKTWIADNRVAVAGGRNVGDEYFAASGDVNFFDLDYLVVGPAVPALSAAFDTYWNSRAAYPVATLSPELATRESLDAVRARSAATLTDDLASPYVTALAGNEPVARLLEGGVPMHWSSRWQVLADDPLKALQADPDARSAVLAGLRAAMAAATGEITLLSPYFVPGDDGTANLVAAQGSGRKVAILTNSLAANDVASVHGGYSRHRKALVAGGIALYELKPGTAGGGNKSWFGSNGASLHSKAALFDRRQVFVGSINLDPRSVSLNSEQGILVDSEAMGAELHAAFAALTAGRVAWRVGLDDDGDLTWSDDTGTSDREPKASFSRRMQARLARWLHLDSQL